ncbi:MAG: hypothetical protein JW829_06765 [Pirellulales bacterium]|nr:hypothetical protein [Pirellulales bacterium]
MMSNETEIECTLDHPFDLASFTKSDRVVSQTRASKYSLVFLGPVVLGLAFAVLLIWTWQRWPDLITDFGREIYIAWQLADGAVLYHDIAYFNGPLSPYFNALALRLFGVSIGTLVVINAILVLGLTALLYSGIRYLSNRWVATLAGFVFLVVFAFGHLKIVGNYNYLCPYSHEMTHGLILSVFMLFLLIRSAWNPKRRRLLSVASGVCWGLVFLGKAELFVAATGAALAVFIWFWTMDITRGRRWLGQGILFVFSGIASVAIATIALATQITPQEAILHIGGTWRYLIQSNVATNDFYRTVMGTDHPLTNLAAMGISFGQVTLFVLAAALCDQAFMRNSFGWCKAALSAGCIGLALILGSHGPPFLLQGLALWIGSGFMTLGFLIAAIRKRKDREHADRLAILAIWGLFAFLLLSKTCLEPRIHHYGFVLAMPATLLLVVCLLHALPQLWCRQTSGNCFRMIISLLILVDTWSYLMVSSSYIRAKNLEIGVGMDRIKTYDATHHPMGPLVVQALIELHSVTCSDSTLAVLPEGALLNYLTRRSNPTGYIVLMPPELEMFDERKILAAFESSHPDFIVLIHKDTSEYGCGPFGSPSYGEQIMHWVRTHYDPIITIGAQPCATDSCEIQILRRARITARPDQRVHHPARRRLTNAA